MNEAGYVPWDIVATIIGSAVIVVGTLIVLNLRSIKHYARGAEDNVKNIENRLRDCKVDCDKSFVDKELFLRETGFTRRTLENLSTSVNQLDGKLTVVEKLPQICGNISREIVKEMKNGASQ